MSLQKKIIKTFDKKDFRWVISLIFTMVSLYKTRTINKFRYDNANSKWMQFHKEVCYFIDSKPNWNLSISYLEQYVNKTNFVQYKPQEGDVIVDIGAGVGTETIIYSMKVGYGKVYSIEAHPETFNKLCLLVSVNKLENIIPSNIAISNEKGIIHIESRDNHVENSILRDNRSGIPITAVTLDEFVNERNIKKINFLKMNIEGAEMNAIQGMKESINIIDSIAISCHDFLFEKNTTEIKDAVIDFLKNNNFTVISKNVGHIVKDSWIYGLKNVRG